ncbi:alpha-amylase family protein [Bdellovibrio bacteriovorus]|uniref:alpha-amylase n=1 Tax=Bdellovibrio bacteriovorus TaxID=959 RepID=UPI0035A694F0
MPTSFFARIIPFFVLLLALQSHAAPRTVFVHLFEWPWKDIARECEIYLGPAGFAAVQVSPPHEHILWQDNPWWERYQVVSYKIQSRSGNETEFADMVRRCRQAGVDVYVDAVINHATGIPGGIGYAGTKFSHYEYPGLYSYNDFHHCGRNGNDNISNFNDRYELQNCELLDLADLATESEYVRTKIADYLNHLLDLGVTGFRIDAAKHIPVQDLAAIKWKLKRSAYIYQEVIYDPRGPVEYNDYLPVGDVMAYDYPRVLAYGFRDKKTEPLQNIAQGFPASIDSIVFVTNHDLERTGNILSYNGSEQNLYRLAQIFMLAWPFGYPQLYSGYAFNNPEQGPPLAADYSTLPILDAGNQCHAPWTCEHRLPEVAAMVDFRNQTDKAFTINNWWSNGRDVLSFSRGAYGFLALNFSNKDITQDFSTTLPEGIYCNILDSGYNIKNKTCAQGYRVSNNRVRILVPAMSAVAFLRKSTTKNILE